ncbi:GAF domain-like protein [Hygrophoropsis aurantiaca]|uniref:GAF domain-like protein n=1 Tax=Hygrophoropsis aurantiaca TaxID=72124 RepID=A0ACB8A715_9AGAM|nr:GAF domain-like protein [Hygrophoropsis aurantiaca]
MPHADASLVPATITSKIEFWDHVHNQLSIVLSGQRNWVTNLSIAASLIYSSLLSFPLHFGGSDRAVNWCGFYLIPVLFPLPRFVTKSKPADARDSTAVNTIDIDDAISTIFLGPYCGKPACQYINVSPGRSRGVCADAYLRRQTMLVENVHDYPGHIACDGDTKSEIVCPLILNRDGEDVVLGVLDLDCLAHAGFNDEDQVGLEKIAKLVVDACDW